MTAIGVIAWRVLRDAVRGRTVLVVGVLFAALTLAISYLGLVVGGVVGFQGLSRTALSVTSLLLYLVPLVAIVQGVASLSGRGGWLELLMAQPVSRAQIALGEFLGTWAAVGGASAVGVAFGAGIVWLRAGGDPAAVGVLVATTVGLSAVFTALGVALGAGFPRRGVALAAALVTWFVCVVLYDLVVVGLTALLGGKALARVLVLAAAANPVDAARIAALGAFVGDTLFGATGAAVEALLGPAGRIAMLAVTSLWTAVALAGAVSLLRRRET